MFDPLNNIEGFNDELKFYKNEKSEEDIINEEIYKEYQEKNQGYWADIDLLPEYYEEDDLISSKEVWEELKSEYEQMSIEELEHRMKLYPPMISDEERCIVIVAINVVLEEREKKYLRIIGIDVLTAMVVTIVDTNALNLFLHSYSLKFVNLIGKMTTIKAKFQYYDSNIRYNIMRIVSDFSVIGQQSFRNLCGLNKKYYELFVCNVLQEDRRSFIFSFDDIKAFAKSQSYEEGYFIGNFTGTKVKKYEKNDRIKYQLMMQVAKQPEFIDIHDNDINIIEKVGLNYKGYALCKWKKYNNSKMGFIIIKLYGDFLNDIDYENIKKKVKQTKGSHDFTDNKWEFIPFVEMDEEPEMYYDEYLDSYYYSYERDEGYNQLDSEYEEFKKSDDAYWFSDDEYIEEER